MPGIQKTHGETWCAVIVGQVYRGSCYPDLVGTHYMTDYCAHELHSAKVSGGVPVFGTPEVNHVNGTTLTAGFPGIPSSLHADARGDVSDNDELLRHRLARRHLSHGSYAVANTNARASGTRRETG